MFKENLRVWTKLQIPDIIILLDCLDLSIRSRIFLDLVSRESFGGGDITYSIDTFGGFFKESMTLIDNNFWRDYLQMKMDREKLYMTSNQNKKHFSN